MKILVTAANGQLGRLVVHSLLASGTDPSTVVATARRTQTIADLADLGVEVRAADYDDRASLDVAFVGVDRVLLVSSSAVGQRVPQHRAVIEAAQAAGVSLLVYTSAPHADTATYALAAEHRATEELLAATSTPTVVLRNGWYLENYTGNVASALESGNVYGSAGEGRVSAATRADLAEAAAVVLVGEGHAGQVYELGGDTAFTMAQYAAALSEASGRPIAYVDVPPEQYAAALAGAGVPAPMAEILADSDRGLARGELFDDSGALSTLLGRPTTSLDEAIAVALADRA